MQLNINTDAVVRFTAKLEKLHKSALPIAIRGALNDAAFDVKQNTMPAKARMDFVNRNPNFFKANSKVEMANGFNINTMKSTVGFFENKLQNQSTNFAVKDLQQQEIGGTIGGKSLIPLNTARASNNASKLVRPNARLKAIKHAVNANNQKGISKKEKFVKAALKAGVGGFVIGGTIKGETILWKVSSLSSNIKSKKFNGKLIPLYDYVKGRHISVHATHFMKKASLESAKKLDMFFVKRAKQQIEKLK